MSGRTAKTKRKTDVATADAPVKYERTTLSEAEAAEFQAAYDAQEPYRAGWTEKENLLLARLGDSVSATFNSRVTDGRLSTIVFERAARVMAQVPTGIIRALTKKDKGKSALMSLLLTKYIQPNAKAQFDHLTKMRLVDLYSQVYGVIPVLYDLSITENYLGPDCWILPIQTWFPQPGKLSIEDSDYNFVETWVSVSWLKAMKGQGSWKSEALDEIIKKAGEDGGSSKSSRPSKERTVAQRVREPFITGGKGDAAQVRMITRYGQGKAGRWKSFFPDFENLVGRDCVSKDGHIPILLKHHIPLLDSIYGLGAFERGKSLQYAMDSLVSMYMAGVQMSIFPPRIINPENVVESSLNYAPGETWIETVKDSIRNYTVSPDGLTTFQSTYGWLTGALLNQNGATDTSQTVASTSDPTSGKTPEALKQQAARESAADNWDRFQMEMFLQNLYERFINLAPKAPKPFTFHIFDDEIKDIKEYVGKDVLEVFDSEKAAKVTMGTSTINECEYKYIIDTGTTIQQDQEAEHEVYASLLNTITSAPQLLEAIEASGYKFNLGEVFRQFVVTGGTKDPETIISKIEAAKPDKTAAALPAGAPAMPGMPPIAADAPMPGADPAAAGGGAAQLAQIMSGAPAPTPPPAPDATKDPDHELIMKLIDKLDPNSLRKLIRSVGLPADSMLPVEADMIKNLSQPSKADEQGIKEDIATIEIDPSSPYGAAKDPHAHLSGTSDPQVTNLYKAIMASGKPGVPLEATDAPVDPATGAPVDPNAAPAMPADPNSMPVAA